MSVLARGLQPPPLAVADPVRRDQDRPASPARPSARRSASPRIAKPRAGQVVEHDLVVHELAVDRHLARVDRSPRSLARASRTPKHIPITSARITRMTASSHVRIDDGLRDWHCKDLAIQS